MSFIPVSEAKSMIAEYQRMRPNLLKEAYPTDVLPICLTLEKSEIIEMLDQDTATSLRIYLGMENQLIDVVVVAADKNGDDVLDPTAPLIGNHSKRCPDSCPTGGLNP